MMALFVTVAVALIVVACLAAWRYKKATKDEDVCPLCGEQLNHVLGGVLMCENCECEYVAYIDEKRRDWR